MSIFGNERRYGLVAQGIHWVTAGLVVWAWVIAGSWGRDESSSILALHQSLGFSVFVLVLVRIVWRLFDRRPAKPPMPGVMAFAAKVSHGLLYALLIAVPASGIAGSWLEGNAITIYGNAIGPLLDAVPRTGQRVLATHHLLATAMMWLAGIHAAAAIFHHVVLRDRVLRQMLPAG